MHISNSFVFLVVYNDKNASDQLFENNSQYWLSITVIKLIKKKYEIAGCWWYGMRNEHKRMVHRGKADVNEPLPMINYTCFNVKTSTV